MIGLSEKIAAALDLPATLLSVACVRTAEPKYLVFDENANHPKYVVQFGAVGKLELVQEHLRQLAIYLPSTVPHPVLLSNEGDGRAMFVQTGLRGLPWFNLRKHVRTEHQWIALRDNLIEALVDFHGKVRQNSTWLRPIDIWQTVSQTATEYLEVAGTPPRGFDALLKAQEQNLRPLGIQECFLQHGDFCINNILIDGDRVGIVDFEHFGKTQMPLHDEFLLVHSLADFFPELDQHLKHQCWELVYSRSQYAEIIQPHHLLGLLLHFLMWWIIETANRPLRRAKAVGYTNTLEALCQNPSRWVGPIFSLEFRLADCLVILLSRHLVHQEPDEARVSLTIWCVPVVWEEAREPRK